MIYCHELVSSPLHFQSINPSKSFCVVSNYVSGLIKGFCLLGFFKCYYKTIDCLPIIDLKGLHYVLALFGKRDSGKQ